MAHVSAGHATNEERNQDATVYVGHLDEKVTEALLWELFLQAGPVQSCYMPKDRVAMKHQGYGFVEFLTEDDADYAIRVMNMIKLFGKPIRVNKASTHNKNLDVGANLFIGNLDPEVDEKLLYDTFSAFGLILKTPRIMRDPDTGNSKGFAFVAFATFDASDAALSAMNGQFLCNRAITISYSFKKDNQGERHGSAAERLLASQNPISQNAGNPNTMFSDSDSREQHMIPSAVQQAMPPSLRYQVPTGGGGPRHMQPPPRPGMGQRQPLRPPPPRFGGMGNAGMPMRPAPPMGFAPGRNQVGSLPQGKMIPGNLG